MDLSKRFIADRFATRTTSRRSALRAGNRAGLLAGIMARAGTGLSRDRARQLAAEPPVPERWRSLFERAFVRAALHAAHTDHRVTASSKYGVA